MAKKWSEVVGSEGFQNLSPEEQVEAQRQYFDTVVAPQAQENGYDIAEVENQFFTQNALTQGEQVEEEAPQTPAQVVSPIPQGQTVVASPVPSEHWKPLQQPTVREQASVWAQDAEQAKDAAVLTNGQRMRQEMEARGGPYRMTRAERRAQRAQQEQPASVWAETLEPALGMRAGYRGDGSVNLDDPRWRGMDEYGIASQVAADERGEMWDAIPSNLGAEDAYTRQVRGKRDEVLREMNPNLRQRELSPEELAAFYGTSEEQPSVWDKVSPETLRENVPQAEYNGTTVLQNVAIQTQKLIDQGYEPAEAERIAMEEEMRTAVQFAAGTATGGLGAGGLAARLGIGALTNTFAGGFSDVMSGKEPTGERMLEDAVYGALGNALGAKGGSKVAEKVVGEEVMNTLKATKSEAVQALDDLAQQSKVKQSIAHSTKSTRPLNEALEGTQAITAKEVADAQATVKALGEINRAGGKTDISQLLSTIKNPELKALLSETAPIRSQMAKVEEKVSQTAGKELVDLLDLGSPATKKANRGAVEKLTEKMYDDLSWSRESLPIAENLSGALRKDFDKVFDELENVRGQLAAGQWAAAQKTLNKGANKRALYTKNFGDLAGQEIQRIRQELQTIVDVGKSTRGHSQGAGIFGKISGMGIPTLVAYLNNPMVGMGISAGKSVARAGVNKVNLKKLAEVERALGGKLKVDAKAEKMLKEGQDVGAVVGYLVSKMLNED